MSQISSHFTRRMFLALGTAGAVSSTLPAFAMKPEVNSPDGLAIQGYDTVAYHITNEAIKGKDAHTSSYKGITWKFVSAENKELFESNPEKYAPAYGGYCAYAVSKGSLASVDPHAFSVHEGRLYLNYSKSVQALWRARRDTHIRSADANWPSVLN